MNLKNYFKLISQVVFNPLSWVGKDNYEYALFRCPRVYAKDGFNVSMQIHYGAYCTSENGYRKLGKDWIDVEFGFPSEHERLLIPYADIFSDEDVDVRSKVGRVPLDLMELIFQMHGGIDWDKSCEYIETPSEL